MMPARGLGVVAVAKVSILWRWPAGVAVSQATVLFSRKNEDHAKEKKIALDPGPKALCI